MFFLRRVRLAPHVRATRAQERERGRTVLRLNLMNE